MADPDFIIYPAIDLLGGQCVRLRQGDYNQVTVYHDDPIAMAQSFRDAGAAWLHVVDLDAARSGVPAQVDLIRAISRATGLLVQTGGGIRTLDHLEPCWPVASPEPSSARPLSRIVP